MQQDRRGIMQMVRSVHMQVLPRYGIPADDAGVRLMQALCSLGMLGSPAIAQKADLSMEISHMNKATLLPAVLKAPKDPERPPPDPIEVILVQLSDEQPSTLRMDLTMDTQVSSLRDKLA